MRTCFEGRDGARAVRGKEQLDRQLGSEALVPLTASLGDGIADGNVGDGRGGSVELGLRRQSRTLMSAAIMSSGRAGFLMTGAFGKRCRTSSAE